MVANQEKNRNTFWLWSNEIDFQKRGDTTYWFPELVILEKHKENISLNQVAQIRGGKRLPLGDKFSDDGKVPYIRTTDFTGGYIDYPKLKRISEKVFSDIKNYQIYKDEVLISIVGTIGAIAILDKEFERCNFTENAAKIVCSEKLNPYYLYTFLTSSIGQQQLKRLTVGGVQPKLPLYAVGEIKILLPNKKIQQQVEQIIKEAFQLKKEAEANYQKSRHLLNETLGLTEIKKEQNLAFWRWSDEIKLVEKLHPNAYKTTKITIKDSVKIGDYAEDLSYGTSEDLTYQNSGIPFLRITDIDEFFQIDKANIKYISKFEAEKVSQYTAKLNEVLISRTGTLGSAILIDELLQNSVFGSYFIKVKFKQNIKEKINLQYLTFFINSEIGKAQSLSLSNGGVQTNLTIQAIKNMEIPLISKGIQDEIVKNFNDFKLKRALSKQKIQEAKELVENLISNNSK